jgi:hypothetical protein
MAVVPQKRPRKSSSSQVRKLLHLIFFLKKDSQEDSHINSKVMISQITAYRRGKRRAIEK